MWVRSKIGRNVKGWQPYENWSYAKGEDTDGYILDDHKRFYDRTAASSFYEGLTVEAGLHLMRQRLQEPKISLRLVGLSGVGKTRFVQALFDERLGEHALNKNEVIYTDMSDGPTPQGQLI